MKPIALGRDASGPAVLAEAGAIARGDYPLARTLYVLALGQPAGPSAELLGFCRSAEARPLLEAAGFVLDAQSTMLANKDDPHSIKVFDPSIKGETDRFAYRFVKP